MNNIQINNGVTLEQNTYGAFYTKSGIERIKKYEENPLSAFAKVVRRAKRLSVQSMFRSYRSAFQNSFLGTCQVRTAFDESLDKSIKEVIEAIGEFQNFSNAELQSLGCKSKWARGDLMALEMLGGFRRQKSFFSVGFNLDSAATFTSLDRDYPASAPATGSNLIERLYFYRVPSEAIAIALDMLATIKKIHDYVVALPGNEFIISYENSTSPTGDRARLKEWGYDVSPLSLPDALGEILLTFVTRAVTGEDPLAKKYSSGKKYCVTTSVIGVANTILGSDDGSLEMIDFNSLFPLMTLLSTHVAGPRISLATPADDWISPNAKKWDSISEEDMIFDPSLRETFYMQMRVPGSQKVVFFQLPRAIVTRVWYANRIILG